MIDKIKIWIKNKKNHIKNAIFTLIFTLVVVFCGLSFNTYKEKQLQILSETNYYKLNCTKTAIDIDNDTFYRCKALDKIVNKDKISFKFPAECDDFDTKLILALKEVESGKNPHAIGDGGKSFGLMQVQYNTAKSLGFKGKPKDLLNPQTNMKYGCMYLSKMLKEKGGNINRALDSYNRGPVAESKRPYQGDWKKHKYVGKVLIAQKRN